MIVCITGQITAGTDKMKGGAGQSIIFELKDGKFYGYENTRGS